MNADELKGALASVLNQAVEAAKAGAEFMKDQIPDVVNQLLMWKMLEALFYPTVALVITFGLLIAALRFKEPFKAYEDAQARYRSFYGEEETKARREMRLHDTGHSVFIALITITGASFALTVISTVNCLPTALQIWIAPKVYLIEYGLHMFK